MNGIAPAALIFAALLAAPTASPAQRVTGPPLRSWSAPPLWSPAWNPRPDRQGSVRRPAPEKVAAPAVVPPTYGLVSIAPCRQYDSRNSTPLAQATPRTVTLTGRPMQHSGGGCGRFRQHLRLRYRGRHRKWCVRSRNSIGQLDRMAQLPSDTSSDRQRGNRACGRERQYPGGAFPGRGLC